MRTSKLINREIEMLKNSGFEFLNDFEMYKIRGGGDGDKIKTKEVDVYDVRED